MKISEIKKEAKAALKGNMWKIFGAVVIMGLIAGIVGNCPDWLGFATSKTTTVNILGIDVEQTTPTTFGMIWSLVSTVCGLVLNVGICAYMLKLVRNEKPTYADLFTVFKNNIVTIVLANLLVSIFINIGTFLLIVPGIIVSLGLSMVNYILVDNPDIKVMDALKKSWDMTKGKKGTIFLLILSFIGWILLCIFLIPVVYVLPYFMVCEAVFYEKIRKA